MGVAKVTWPIFEVWNPLLPLNRLKLHKSNFVCWLSTHFQLLVRSNFWANHAFLPRDAMLALQTTPSSTFCGAFHISVMGENRHFKFGGYTCHSMSQLSVTNRLWKARGQGHVTIFIISHPMKYLWNDWSYRLRILRTVWSREVY